MGWAFQRQLEHFTPREQVLSEFDGQDIVAQSYHRSVDIPGHEEGELYLAVRLPTDEVFALVVLVEAQGNQVGYKVMDEAMGPFYYSPSTEVLEALSPVEDVFSSEYSQDHARHWRETCVRA